MTELFRLRHNQSLVELDLRLNPVGTSDPGYRLFLIHLLPNLQVWPAEERGHEGEGERARDTNDLTTLVPPPSVPPSRYPRVCVCPCII